jgi:1-deoxy-D-xylulose 5-phosphate reductoisomerase
MKRISVFGATGSIGQSTLDLVKRDREILTFLRYLAGGILRNSRKMQFPPELRLR